MEKSRTPKSKIGKNSQSNKPAKNSPSKNSSSNNKRKKLVSQNAVIGFFGFAFHKMLAWIHTNFIPIMCAAVVFNLIYLFINSTNDQRIFLFCTSTCILAVLFRKYIDSGKRIDTIDKFRNFKRFTHKRANGSIGIKQGEIEQAILYLYEIEEFLGKSDKQE